MPNLTPCDRHHTTACTDTTCQNDNGGKLGLATNGDLTVGIGSGLAIDLSTGGLAIGGISL